MTDEDWREIADAQYVSLGTYRRNGRLVETPVWTAADGDALVVTTEAGTGKVKRLRHDPRVRLRPCSRTGAVAPGATVVTAEGYVMTGPQASATAALAGKYGLVFTLFLRVERLLRPLRRRPVRRVVLRITRA